MKIFNLNKYKHNIQFSIINIELKINNNHNIQIYPFYDNRIDNFISYSFYNIYKNDNNKILSNKLKEIF